MLSGAAIARAAFLLRDIHYADDFLHTLVSFWHGLPLDLAVAAYTFIPVLPVCNIFDCNKLRLPLLVYYQCIHFCLFLLNAIDAELFIHWGARLNYAAMFYSQHLGDAFASVDFPIVIAFVIVFITQFVVFYFILKRLLSSLLNKMAAVPRLTWLSFVSICLLMLISGVLMRGGIGKVPINQSRVVYSSNHYLNTASVNSLWSFCYNFLNKDNRVKYEQFQLVNESIATEFLKQNLEQGVTISPPLFKENTHPNVILLILESLSAETFQRIGGTYDWTQSMNHIMDSAYFFSKMYASGNRTDKGLVALLNGFPAQPLTSILFEPEKASKLSSVSCILAKNQYSNTFIYGGDISFANMGYYLKNTCFDHIIDEKNISSRTAKGSWGYHDQDVFAELKNQLTQTQSPFFISLLSLSTHEPYDIPVQNHKPNKMEAAYRYTDSCVYDFIDWFKQSKYYSNTILVITGDHGRDVGIDYGQFFAKQKFHIPALILGGALHPVYKGKSIDNPVSQTSLLPFLLQNMNYPVYSFIFYHNPLSQRPFALYSFDNGFGLIYQDKFIAWDNILNKITTYEPNTKHVDEFNESALFGRIYQQIFMKKYFELNRK